MAILSLPGSRLYYEAVDGPADGPVLVFLHEGLGCVAMWKAFPRRLCAAAGLAGLVYDRAGFGLSSPAVGPRTARYLHESALDELPQVLEGTVPGREHILVGHSDGGSIALLYAASRPRGLRGVITEAAHVRVEPVTLRGLLAAVEAWEAGKLGGLARYHGERAEAVFRAWSEAWRNPEFHSWNIEGDLCRIACPVLALQGDGDQYGTPAQVESIRTGTKNGRGIILANCGHAPHQEQPDRVAELMVEFIAACSGRMAP